MDRRVKILVALATAVLPTLVTAGTFNLFQPANGILVGNPNTYVTTAATSANVRALWSGTCDSTTYLRGDGQCQAPPGGGGGTVDEVDFTAPSVFSVTGAPVTTTGTIALDWATGQTANSFLATPDGSTGAVSLRAIVADDLPAIDLTSGVTGTLPVGNGGTGAASLTDHGVLVGSGTGAVTALSVLTDDQILVGSTGADPTTATLVNCGSSTQALAYNTSTNTFTCQTISAGTGTVTSVAATAPSVFSVTGSPVTTSGTLALDWATGQTQNRVLASPNGSSGAVSLRALVGADIPQISLASSGNGGVTGNLPVANLNGGTGASSASAWAGNGTWKSAGFLGDAQTWTATQTFAPTSGVNAVFNGSANSASFIDLKNQNTTYGYLGNGTSVTGSGNTVLALGGVGSTLFATGAAASTLRATLTAGLFMAGATGNDQGAGTINATGVYDDGVLLANQTGANPSASIGLSAVNGSAGTFMRSDAAPALNQAITPTWSGLHTYSGPDALRQVINSSNAGGPYVTWQRNGTSFADMGNGAQLGGGFTTDSLAFGARSGFAIQMSANGATTPHWQINTSGNTVQTGVALGPAGTAGAPTYSASGDPNTGLNLPGSDVATISTGGTNRVTINNSGVQVGAPTGGAQGDGTINATGLYIQGVPVTGGATETGSFTGTMTGMTSSPTCTVKYRKTGQLVYIYTTTNDCLGTSNANTMTMTGVPVAIRPARGVTCLIPAMQDNGSPTFGAADIGGGVAAGTIQLNKATTVTGNTLFGSSLWTSSGTKGPTSTWSCQYDLDS